jgi:hypothetical protein
MRRVVDMEEQVADVSEEIITSSLPTAEECCPDYIFVLTQSFSCALLAYNKEKNRIDCVSRGNFSEKVSVEKKEPPYPTFLAEDNSFIALMLFENLIKIIPLVPSQEKRLVLANAVNLRVKHSDISAVIPLYSNESAQPQFGVLYQKIEHVQVNGKPC